MRTDEDHGPDRGWYHHLSGLLVLPNNQAATAAAAAPIPDSHDCGSAPVESVEIVRARLGPARPDTTRFAGQACLVDSGFGFIRLINARAPISPPRAVERLAFFVFTNSSPFALAPLRPDSWTRLLRPPRTSFKPRAW